MYKYGKKFLFLSIVMLMLFSIIFVSCPNKTPAASINYTSGVQWNFTKDSKIENETRDYEYFTIELQNVKTASDLTTESQIQHWTITPKIAGTSWKITSVSEDRTSFALGISGTPTETLEATPIVVVIPRSALDNPEGVDEKLGLSVNMNNSTIAVKEKAPEPVDPDPSDPDTPTDETVEPTIEISEISFEGQPRETLSDTITVTVTNATFKKDLSKREDGVRDWFSDSQEGFTYTLKSIGDDSQKSSIKSVKEASSKTDKATIEIKGAFKNESTEDFTYTVKIPADAFNEKVKDSKTTEGSGTIKRSLAYKAATWKLYDSASFKNVANLSSDQSENLNAGLTQYAIPDEGLSTVIPFASDKMIASGDKTLVKLERGLSRKGYKLVGFAEADGSGNVDVSNVKYTKTLSDLQDGFLIPKDSNVSLYAIWAVDDSKYWKSIDTITITKDEILAANADLRMHDGTTEIADGYTQSFDFIALPGGRIGGTDENPTYFEWPVDDAFARYADETNTKKVLHEAIFSDFAIADIPVTGGLYAIVKKWADDNGYKFETGSKYNVAAIGGVKSNVDRMSVEDPTIQCNWANAIVLANAMTEWYNEKHPESPLTPVYLNEDGTVFKDASDGSDIGKYMAKYSTGQGVKYDIGDTAVKKKYKTGFRLPTYTEWLYAASVSPNTLDSTWILEGDGAYPFAHSYNYISGYNGDVATDENIKDYAVYASLYPEDDGTQTVGKLAQNGNVRYGVKPNLVHLYDMSGNVNEYTEDISGVHGVVTDNRRFYIGGSWLSSKDSILSIGSSAGSGYGFHTQTISNLKTKMAQGIRLVRTIAD